MAAGHLVLSDSKSRNDVIYTPADFSNFWLIKKQFLTLCDKYSRDIPPVAYEMPRLSVFPRLLHLCNGAVCLCVQRSTSLRSDNCIWVFDLFLTILECWGQLW